LIPQQRELKYPLERVVHDVSYHISLDRYLLDGLVQLELMGEGAGLAKNNPPMMQLFTGVFESRGLAFTWMPTR
jgi:hypothetical protein